MHPNIPRTYTILTLSNPEIPFSARSWVVGVGSVSEIGCLYSGYGHRLGLEWMDWFCTRSLTLPTVGVIQPPTPKVTFLAGDECVPHVQWKLYRLKDHMERCLSCCGGQI